jgi:hypothetical protein
MDFWDFFGDSGCYFLVFGISWEILGVIFCDSVGFWDFLGEPRGFPGFPGRTLVEIVGMGLGELQELVRGKVAGGVPLF